MNTSIPYSIEYEAVRIQKSCRNDAPSKVMALFRAIIVGPLALKRAIKKVSNSNFVAGYGCHELMVPHAW
jgi:hypothetical protein